MASDPELARIDKISNEALLCTDEEDDDDSKCENQDVHEPNEEKPDDIEAATEACGDEELTEKDKPTEKSVTVADEENDVVVMVTCDDKKMKKWAKRISRAVRRAINCIIARFNLKLKVHLDLNVSNKDEPAQENEIQNKPGPSNPDGKPKPTPEQLQARIDELQTKVLSEEAKARQLCDERDKLQLELDNQTSAKKQLEVEISQLHSQISDTQRKLDASLEQYESQKKYIVSIENDKKKHSTRLEEEQVKSRQLYEERNKLKQQVSDLEYKLRCMQSDLNYMKTQRDYYENSAKDWEKTYRQCYADLTSRR